MSRLNPGIPAAALAIIAVLGSGVAATAQTEAPSAPTATQQGDAAPAGRVTAETLPESLRALNLSDLEIQTGRRGHARVHGNLADGTQIDAVVDRDGALRGVRARDDAALPQSLIEAVLPQPVRANPIIEQFSLITGLGVMSKMVMVGGQDAEGQNLRAGFDQDGTLMRFGRGDDRGPAMHQRGGKRAFEGRDHGKGEQRMDRRGARAPVDGAALRQSLADAGYTDLGTISRDGRRTTLEAVNANGENVTVELNRQGQVIRETAR